MLTQGIEENLLVHAYKSQQGGITMRKKAIRGAVALIMLAICVLFCGCSNSKSNITIDETTEIKAEDTTEVTETATETTEVTTEPESTEPATINVEELGFTEVSSIEDGLNFLFEDYEGYPEVWKEMTVKSIAEEVKGGKVGKNVNLDDYLDTDARSALYWYWHRCSSGYALDKMLIQNQQYGQIYIYELNDEMTYDKLLTLPGDELRSWSAMWLRPRIKIPDETYVNELKDVYIAREEIWNEKENGDRYQCISGNIILDSGESPTLKDWYFCSYYTILCKTVSDSYLIISGWDDYTDTIYYIDDESGSKKDTAESNLLNSITAVMPLN